MEVHSWLVFQVLIYQEMCIRDRMYEFADRLINLALPRVRDFRGVNANAFDGRGNYALGIKEQLIFPEIEYDKVDKVRGMDVIFVTTAKTDEEARELLTLFNLSLIHISGSLDDAKKKKSSLEEEKKKTEAAIKLSLIHI